MARSGAGRHGEKQGDAAEPPGRTPFTRLLPPTKNKPLLIVAAALVAAWTVFLIWMALV